MTGDQWYNLLRIALYLAFAALILFGIYKLATHDASRNDDN